MDGLCLESRGIDCKFGLTTFKEILKLLDRKQAKVAKVGTSRFDNFWAQKVIF